MKILFVVTAFYPEQAIGSIRVTKTAKYLQRQGASVTVISLSPPPWAKQDESLYFSGLENMRWDVVDQSGIFKRIFHRARVATVGKTSAVSGGQVDSRVKSWKRSVKLGAQLVYTLLKAVDWMICVRHHVRTKMATENFDVIYTSYPSFASPFSGIMLRRMEIGKQLVLDFRDPVVASSQQGCRFYFRRLLQSRMVQAADLRVFVSEGVRQSVIGSEPTRYDKIMNNGFDEEDLPSPNSETQIVHEATSLRLVYTGALYGGQRDLRPFFAALSQVLAVRGQSSDTIILDYAGNEGDLFKAYAEEFALSSCVIDHGRISRAQSLALQASSDVCLLATWNTEKEQGVLTGKVFEYFMLRKPVIAIVSGDRASSEIGRVIDKVGAGYCYESVAQDDMPDLVDWIGNALDAKTSDGQLPNTYNQFVCDFEFGGIVSKFHDELDTLLNVKALS